MRLDTVESTPPAHAPRRIRAPFPRRRCVRLLLEQPSISVNQAANDGCTPLIAAAHSTHDPGQVVQALLNHRANLADKCAGRIALEWAQHQGNTACARALQMRAARDEGDRLSRT